MAWNVPSQAMPSTAPPMSAPMDRGHFGHGGAAWLEAGPGVVWGSDEP